MCLFRIVSEMEPDVGWILCHYAINAQVEGDNLLLEFCRHVWCKNNENSGATSIDVDLSPRLRDIQ